MRAGFGIIGDSSHVSIRIPKNLRLWDHNYFAIVFQCDETESFRHLSFALLGLMYFTLSSLVSCHVPPLLGIAGYLAYPKQARIHPTLLYFVSVIHNARLVAFSAWTFVSLSHVLYNDGIVLQSNYYFQNPEFDAIMYLFYISKYYEFQIEYSKLLASGFQLTIIWLVNGPRSFQTWTNHR